MIDFGKLSKQQLCVFGQISIGNDGGHHPKTLESLLKKGLVQREKQILPGRFPVRIWRYFVPINVHIEWCQWCHDNYSGQDDE